MSRLLLSDKCTTVLRSIYKEAAELGCCARCCLRLAGVHHASTAYTGENLEKALAQLLDISVKQDDSDDKYCSSCLGLLEDGSVAKDLLSIIAKLEAEKYCFDSYQLYASIPPAISLRDGIIVAKIKTKGLYPEGSGEISSVKDVWRSMLSKHLSDKFKIPMVHTSPFQISVTISHSTVDNEFNDLVKEHPKLFYPRLCKKSMPTGENGLPLHFNHTSIARVVDLLGDKGLAEMNIQRPDTLYKISRIELTSHSLYVVGRYNKYSRNLSQTPWLVDGKKRMEYSLQDKIVDEIVKLIHCEKTKFSSCGREDVDVQMLGRGRPFVVEVMNPKTHKIPETILDEIENQVNQNEEVAIRDIQLATKDEVQKNLKQGEASKRKEYSALCCLNRPVTEHDLKNIASVQNLVIYQKTPIRVLHRRSLVTRKRTVYTASADYVPGDERLLRLKVLTEAGTYVKEFVHSDFGRTEPNLATIVGNS